MVHVRPGLPDINNGRRAPHVASTCSLAVIRRLLPPLHNAAVSTSGGEKRRRPQSNRDGGHAEVVFVGRPEDPGLGSMDGTRWTG